MLRHFFHFSTATTRAFLFAQCVLLCCVATIRADGVSVRMDTQQAEVGEFVRLVVDVEGASGFESITEPKVEGLVFRRLPGQQTQTSVAIINNKRTQRVTSSATFELVATRAGTFKIPPFTAMIGGNAYTSQPMEFSVKAANDAPVLEVRIEGVPSTVYLGQKCAIRLEILIKPFRAREFNYVMTEEDSWNIIQGDLEQSELGPFKQELLRQRREGQRPSGQRVHVAGEEYWRFRIEREYDPVQPGTPDFGPIRIDLHYPASLSKRRDVFGMGSSLQIASSRFVSATAASADMTVLAVPMTDQPQGYAGAVGSFTMRASVAPSTAAVGDPMTLSIEIVDRDGGADLGALQAPDLSIDPAFSGNFKIPAERAAGRIDGNRKVFTQTLRPLNDRVHEVPAITFSAFDPTTERFETTSSDAIPITVHASEQVRLSDDAMATIGDMHQPKTRVGGLLANAAPLDAARLGSTFKFAPWSIAAFALPPLAAGVLFLARRRSASAARDPMRNRRRDATKRATSRLACASSAAERQSALLEFVTDRAGLPAHALTRNDVCKVLSAAGAGEALVAGFDRAVQAAERATYGGASMDTDADGKLALRALESVADAKLNWARAAQELQS